MKPLAFIVGLVFGALFGALLGFALDNRPLGFAVGLVGGLGVALMLNQWLVRRKDRS